MDWQMGLVFGILGLSIALLLKRAFRIWFSPEAGCSGCASGGCSSRKPTSLLASESASNILQGSANSRNVPCTGCPSNKTQLVQIKRN